MPHGDMYAILKKGEILAYFAPLPNDTFLVVLPRVFRRDPIHLRYSIVTRSHFEKITAGTEFQPETRTTPPAW